MSSLEREIRLRLSKKGIGENLEKRVSDIMRSVTYLHTEIQTYYGNAYTVLNDKRELLLSSILYAEMFIDIHVDQINKAKEQIFKTNPSQFPPRPADFYRVISEIRASDVEHVVPACHREFLPAPPAQSRSSVRDGAMESIKKILAGEQVDTGLRYDPLARDWVKKNSA